MTIKKAMVFAAGKGTRLRPLTDNTPKCLVDIGGISILEHVVERLKAVGVDYLVVNVSYLADKVKAAIAEKNNFGIEVVISEEQELLDTGGALKKAAPYLDDVPYFYIHNADIFSDIDLQALENNVVNTGSEASLATFKFEQEPRCLVFDDNNLLLGWRNRSTDVEKLIAPRGDVFHELNFMGVHLISQKMLTCITEESDEKFSIITSYLDAAKKGYKISATEYSNPIWNDIGTIQELEKVRVLVKNL